MYLFKIPKIYLTTQPKTSAGAHFAGKWEVTKRGFACASVSTDTEHMVLEREKNAAKEAVVEEDEGEKEENEGVDEKAVCVRLLSRLQRHGQLTAWSGRQAGKVMADRGGFGGATKNSKSSPFTFYLGG